MKKILLVIIGGILLSSCVNTECYYEFVGYDIWGDEVYEEVCYY